MDLLSQQEPSYRPPPPAYPSQQDADRPAPPPVQPLAPTKPRLDDPSDEPPTAPPRAAPFDTAALPPTKSNKLPLVGVGVVLLLVLGGGYWFTQGRSPTEGTTPAGASSAPAPVT